MVTVAVTFTAVITAALILSLVLALVLLLMLMPLLLRVLTVMVAGVVRDRARAWDSVLARARAEAMHTRAARRIQYIAEIGSTMWPWPSPTERHRVQNLS